MSSAPTTYSGLVNEIIDIINVSITTLIAVLFVYFIWKMIDTWILHGGDQNKREEGKRYMVAAVVTMVLMVSTWGIIWLIRMSLFGL